MAAIFALALLVSAFAALQRNFRLRPEEAWLYAGILSCSEAVLLTLGLGLGGRLSSGAVCAATWALTAAHMVLYFVPQNERLGRRAAAAPLPWALWPAAAAAVLVLGIRLAIAGAVPPDSWDGLSYHLPIVLRWIQQGNLDLAGWPGPERYYAWNGELLSAWLALLGGGSLSAAKLCQVAGLPVLLAAAGALGRRLAGPGWSWACGLAAAAMPIVVIQSGVPYVDVLYSAFWLAAAAAGVAWLRSGGVLHMGAYAAAFGLALGSKSTAYLTAPLLIPLAVALWSRPAARREFVRWSPLWVGLVALTGLACYWRNWLQTGNPIFPFELRVAGWTVFRGITRPGDLLVSMEKWFFSSMWGWAWYPFVETIKGQAVYTYENGFGPVAAAAWALSPVAFWKAWRRRDAAALAFLALLPLTAALFLIMHPVRVPRYVIFLPLVCIVALAYVFKRAGPRLRTAVLAAWALAVLVGVSGVADYLVRNDASSYAWSELRRGRSVDAWRYYKDQFLSLGEAWAALDQRLRPGDVVAVNYSELMLPWSGMPTKARVVAVRHSAVDYPGAYFGATDREWLDLLQKLQVHYLAVWSPSWYKDEGDLEREAISQLPARFRSLGKWQDAQMGSIEIFEFLPAVI
ncbi:MAG: hypothetical protein WC881_02790 [Elusimicrobiota bacterium]|jgi:hypothetical protein